MDDIILLILYYKQSNKAIIYITNYIINKSYYNPLSKTNNSALTFWQFWNKLIHQTIWFWGYNNQIIALY